jgi:ATP-binding cassette subfamily F protein uup
LAFSGVGVVVSHDRYFLNRVATHILAFEGDGRVVFTPGNFDYYLEKKKERQAAAAAWEPVRKPEQTNTSAPPKPGNANKPKKLSFKEAQELQGMEARIAECEANVQRIEAMFADPDFHRKFGPQTAELTEELSREKEKINELFQRWEALEAIRSAAESPKAKEATQ